MTKNPYDNNTAAWWLWDKINSKELFIASQEADIKRAEGTISVALAEIAKAKEELTIWVMHKEKIIGTST